MRLLCRALCYRYPQPQQPGRGTAWPRKSPVEVLWTGKDTREVVVDLMALRDDHLQMAGRGRSPGVTSEQPWENYANYDIIYTMLTRTHLYTVQVCYLDIVLVCQLSQED